MAEIGARIVPPARQSPSEANGYGGVFPVDRLKHLVLAACGPADGVAAWRLYLDRLGALRADEGERRLYPLVEARIGDPALVAAEAAPLRAQRRAALVRHEILFTAAAQIQTLFASIGVEPILMKGMALQIRVFGERCTRASSDVDLFIPRDRLADCLAIVEAQGWTRAEARPRTRDAALIGATQTKLNFRTPSGVEVDLHWVPRQVLEFDVRATADFVAAAHHLPFRGRSWLVPSDNWLLFETIDHGMAWNQVTPIRWLSDALSLLECRDAAIDWEALCDMVERSRLTLSFAKALAVMAAYSDRVPGAIIERLAARPASLLERIHTQCRLQPPASPFFGMLLSASHLGLRAPGGIAARAFSMPAYYRDTALKCLSWADVFARAVEKVRRK